VSFALIGIGIGSGIAIGQVHRLTVGELTIPEFYLDATAVDGEIERLERAIDRADQFLERMLARLDNSGESTRELLEAHRLMVRDPLLIERTCQTIGEQRINAEWALFQQSESLIDEFKRLDNEYMALRREDLEQAVGLIQRELADRPALPISAQVPHQLDQTIIVAPSLGPAEMAVLHQRAVAGLVTEHGGPVSHAAILARGLEIPMIVGVHHATRCLREGESIILDGHYGALLVGFEEGLQRHYAEKRELSLRHRAELKRFLARPSRTRDARRFNLFGNAELPAEVARCHEAKSAGLGLMRTEYLFMERYLPSEETQYRAYRAAVQAMRGKPVTIRTLDAGGDKLSAGLQLDDGPNPALGLRGLRLSLAYTDVFRDQIRAILRASQDGPVQILLPMLTHVEEVHQARRLIDACREDLLARGLKIDPEIPLGGMIETPAAALAVDQLAGVLDFLSIGTNDLIQYVLAIDRQDEQVSYLYDPGHPGILFLIERIVAAGHSHARAVTVCGELAGDPAGARLLLGLGVVNFSMPPTSIPAIKKSLVETSYEACRETVQSFRSDGRSGRELLAELEKSQ